MAVSSHSNLYPIPHRGSCVVHLSSIAASCATHGQATPDGRTLSDSLEVSLEDPSATGDALAGPQAGKGPQDKRGAPTILSDRLLGSSGSLPESRTMSEDLLQDEQTGDEQQEDLLIDIL